MSDDEIIAEMLGRRLDRLYPERKPTATDRIALKIRGLSVGHRLQGVDLDLKEGEVLGVGGLQGHGQRELFQALFGVGKSKGSVELWDRPLHARSPRQALDRRHRPRAGGSARPGPAARQAGAREPDALGHPALLARAASSTAGARRRWSPR